MKLMCLASEVQHLANDAFLTSVMAHAPELRDYELPFARVVDLTALQAGLSAFVGRRLGSDCDAQMADVVRANLPLTPAEASDRAPWWWLAISAFPELTRARWAKETEAEMRITPARMLGTVGRNMFARLWWAGELVRTLPAEGQYLEKILASQDLFEAAIGRRLARNPEALAVLLDELSDVPGEAARLTIRDLRLVLSTLVLEALPADELRGHVRRLLSRHFSAAGGPTPSADSAALDENR